MERKHPPLEVWGWIFTIIGGIAAVIETAPTLITRLTPPNPATQVAYKQGDTQPRSETKSSNRPSIEPVPGNVGSQQPDDKQRNHAHPPNNIEDLRKPKGDPRVSEPIGAGKNTAITLKGWYQLTARGGGGSMLCFREDKTFGTLTSYDSENLRGKWNLNGRELTLSIDERPWLSNFPNTLQLLYEGDHRFVGKVLIADDEVQLRPLRVDDYIRSKCAD